MPKKGGRSAWYTRTTPEWGKQPPTAALAPPYGALAWRRAAGGCRPGAGTGDVWRLPLHPEPPGQRLVPGSLLGARAIFEP